MADNTCLQHAGIVEQYKAICIKLELLEKMIEKQFEMHERAIETAKNELERRLEGMNAFREDLSRQSQTFISRSEIDLLFSKMDVKIDSLQAFQSERRGSLQWSHFVVMSALAALITLIGHYLFKL